MITEEEFEKFKSDWISTLRSGKYKQGRFRLYNDSHSSYCCLGVGCTILGEEKDSLNGFNFPRRDSELRKYLSFGGMHTLSHLNDFREFSFSDIADYIQENFIYSKEERHGIL